jgi:predicted dehydrogenase
MPPIKLGIIGTGIAARELHWPALHKLTDKFEIIAVCNHTEPKAQQFAQLVGGVPYMLDYRELLQIPEVEAVDLILPIHLNYQFTKAALEADKHVIVEKPLAANLREAKLMRELDSTYSPVKMVAENLRYNPVYRRAHALIEDHRIGEPYAAFWNSFGKIDENNKYAQTEWRLHHQYPGGFVMDAGVHNIAVLRDMFGEFVEVKAFTKSVRRHIGEIDSMSLQFAAEKNVHGVFNIFFSADGHSENRLLILGTEGSLLVENNESLAINKNGEKVLDEEVENDNGYTAEFEDFYEAIRNGKLVASSFHEAYQDFAVMVRALESARGEQPT